MKPICTVIQLAVIRKALLLILSVIFSASLLSAQIVISENSGAVPNDGLICEGDQVTLTAPSAIAYSWNTGENSQAITDLPLSTVSYTVTITFSGGNMDTLSTTIQVDPGTVAEAGPDQVLTCQETEVTLFGDGSSTGPNITYNWTTTDGNILAAANTLNPVVDEPGTYTIIVVDVLTGCSSMDDVLVTTDYSNPTTSISDTICEGESYLFNGNTYLVAGVYTDTFISAQNGCDSLVTLNLFVNPTGILNLTPTICWGDTFTWDGIPYDVNNPSANLVYPNLAANGCDSIVNINLSFIPPVLTSLTPTLCSNDSLVINGTLYDINNPVGTEVFVDGSSAGCDSTVQVDITFTDTLHTSLDTFLNCISPIIFDGQPITVPGTYIAEFTSSNGCDSIVQLTVFDQNPVVTIVAPTLTCTDDTLCFDILPGACPPYSVLWSTGDTTNTFCIPSISGQYCVTITDCNGCTANTCVDIVVSPPMVITIDSTSCVTSSGNDGALYFSVSGGTPPYLYSIDNGVNFGTTPFFNNLAAQPQTITVLDVNGCLADTTIQDISGLIQSPLNQSYELCAGTTTDLLLSAPGAVSYSWTPATFLSCSNCATPSINPPPNSNITYTVFVTDANDCLSVAEYEVITFADDYCVWPGDTDTNKVVNNGDLLNIGIAMGINSNGPVRPNASLSWEGQPGPDWNEVTPGDSVNFKHIDTDGNGSINADDTLAINMNWGLMHNFTLPPVTRTPQTAPFYVEPDTLIPGDTVSLAIMLGDSNNVISGFYGLAFSLNYDTALVEPGTPIISFGNSWTGTDNVDLLTMYRDFSSAGRIDIALVRNDGLEKDGSGMIASLDFIIQDDILLKPDNDSRTPFTSYEFSIDNVLLINFDKEMIPVIPQDTEIPVGNPTNLKNLGGLNAKVQLFPNPAHDRIFVNYPADWDITKFYLHNSLGQVIKSNSPAKELNVSGLQAGSYYLQLVARDGTRLIKPFLLLPK